MEQTVLKELEQTWKEILKDLPLEYLVNELERRGLLLLSYTCPHCEQDFDIPPEILVVDIGKV